MATLAHLLNTNYQTGNDFGFCSDRLSKRDQRPAQMPFDQSVTQNIDFSWLRACVFGFWRQCCLATDYSES